MSRTAHLDFQSIVNVISFFPKNYVHSIRLCNNFIPLKSFIFQLQVTKHLCTIRAKEATFCQTRVGLRIDLARNPITITWPLSREDICGLSTKVGQGKPAHKKIYGLPLITTSVKPIRSWCQIFKYQNVIFNSVALSRVQLYLSPDSANCTARVGK